VRRLLLRAAAGLSLGLALVAGWTLQLAPGSELKTRDPRTGKVPAAVKAVPAKPAEDGECTQAHGTSVQFFNTPSEAAREAKKEGKLVFVLHISGNFEDPGFT
jgi:hypothetical protein